MAAWVVLLADSKTRLNQDGGYVTFNVSKFMLRKLSDFRITEVKEKYVAVDFSDIFE